MIRLFVSVNVILSFFLILQKSINLFLLGILTCNLPFKNPGFLNVSSTLLFLYQLSYFKFNHCSVAISNQVVKTQDISNNNAVAD